jgi:phosphoribosylaminoimidazole-succinocarboxamide synthase
MNFGPRAVERVELPGIRLLRRGKVRDVFELRDGLLIVATDRISAYDFPLTPPIPGKGIILNALSNFWFEKTAALVPNHLLATDFDRFPTELQPFSEMLAGRSVWVRKAEVVPIECVARGYLAGSAWREYTILGTVAGEPLPSGLRRSERLPQPIFTPATKAASGHDENLSRAELALRVGRELAEELEALTLELYRFAHAFAEKAQLILADTKFEFGWIDGRLHLIDEVLTPDSSRYWEASSWEPGVEPVSFDKQFVRNYLDHSGWDHLSPPPPLPPEVVGETRKRYLEAFYRLTRQTLHLP